MPREKRPARDGLVRGGKNTPRSGRKWVNDLIKTTFPRNKLPLSLECAVYALRGEGGSFIQLRYATQTLINSKCTGLICLCESAPAFLKRCASVVRWARPPPPPPSAGDLPLARRSKKPPASDRAATDSVFRRAPIGTERETDGRQRPRD